MSDDCRKVMAFGLQFGIGTLYNYVEDKIVPSKFYRLNINYIDEFKLMDQ